MTRPATLPSLSGQKQSLNGQKQRSRVLPVLFARAKTVCALVIALVLLLQFHSFVYRQMDDEALQYRGVIRWKVPDTKYQQAAAAKARLPKTKEFSNLTPATLQQRVPIWVISLARATARRKSITQHLAAAGITSYELVDAANYHNVSSVTTADLHRYAHGWRRYMWYQNRTRYSSKVAVDISHFRLWQRLAAADQPAIILEDDVKLAGGNWTQHLLTVLNELPQDWDVFYLAASCCQILGQNVSRHLVPVFGTAGAMAYMMTPAFARKAVRAASDPRLNTWVDLVLQLMGRHFEGHMYLAQPPMVTWGELKSTLNAHYTEAASDSKWEQWWMRYRHMGISW